MHNYHPATRAFDEFPQPLIGSTATYVIVRAIGSDRKIFFGEGLAGVPEPRGQGRMMIGLVEHARSARPILVMPMTTAPRASSPPLRARPRPAWRTSRGAAAGSRRS